MKTVFLFILLLPFIGCGLANSTFFIHEYDIGKTKSVSVGSSLMAWGYGSKNDVYNNVEGGIRKELLYGGIAQNVVQISYREFSLFNDNGYPRPAFTQELKYDLNTSKTITFQDIKIRVDSANSERILFVVLNEPSDVQTVKRATGIGALGMFYDKSGVVYRLEEEGPASKAGVGVDDKITEVNHQPIYHYDTDEIKMKLAGKAGTPVQLGLIRSGKYVSINVVRQ